MPRGGGVCRYVAAVCAALCRSGSVRPALGGPHVPHLSRGSDRIRRALQQHPPGLLHLEPQPVDRPSLKHLALARLRECAHEISNALRETTLNAQADTHVHTQMCGAHACLACGTPRRT